MAWVCCRAHRVRSRARRRAALPTEPDQADPRRPRRVDRSRGVAGTAEPRGQRSKPGPSRAVQQVRSAARAESAASVWPAPRDPGRPAALPVGRIGDAVGEGRAAFDGAPGGAAPPTNQRLGGRAPARRTRHPDAPDPDRFVAEFSNDGRCVADDLTGEILNHLRPDPLRFCGPSAFRIPSRPKWRYITRSGRADAGAMLDSLEHDTSLVYASVGSATPTVCSRSCAPISMPTHDATSVLVGCSGTGVDCRAAIHRLRMNQPPYLPPHKSSMTSAGRSPQTQ